MVAHSSLRFQAEIYQREHHDEQAYLLLFRHAQLVLYHLANHPEAKNEIYQKGLSDAERMVKVNIKKLEELRPRINKRYERYMQLMRERESRRPTSSSQSNSLPQSQHLSDYVLDVSRPLVAGENRELAVKLAQREINRRASARRATQQAGISQEKANTRRAAGVWVGWEDALNRDQARAGDDLSRRIREIRTNIDQSQAERRQYLSGDQSSGPLIAQENSLRTTVPAYKYPSVPRQKPFDFGASTIIQPQDKINEPERPPELPPKERRRGETTTLEAPPPVPNKVSPAPPPPEKVEFQGNARTPPPDLNPSTFTFKPSAYLENGTPLRTVFLPPNLRTHFLKIASPDTRRNLETCGILCGTLVSNALFISTLLIPEQESTSDTCETVNESAIFDYCDSEDLIVLGWIHTHPTQTCFMSSRDLHTQCGYQVMLPESIAIVCAPSKNPDWGVFRLTDPPGLKTVLNCTQKGLFHPHAESDIYTDALRPGHVFEAQGLEFEIVDLRPKI
jgi:STAM-binding protein